MRHLSPNVTGQSCLTSFWYYFFTDNRAILSPDPVSVTAYACAYLATSVEVDQEPRMTQKMQRNAGDVYPSPSILHIRLLGDFQLALDDRLLTTLNTARLQCLQAYLVLHR